MRAKIDRHMPVCSPASSSALPSQFRPRAINRSPAFQPEEPAFASRISACRQSLDQRSGPGLQPAPRSGQHRVSSVACRTPFPGSAGGSGFLGTVASTAAGIVAATFLFRGIHSPAAPRSCTDRIRVGPGPSCGHDARQPQHSDPGDSWLRPADSANFLSDGGEAHGDNGFGDGR